MKEWQERGKEGSVKGSSDRRSAFSTESVATSKFFYVQLSTYYGAAPGSLPDYHGQDTDHLDTKQKQTSFTTCVSNTGRQDTLNYPK